MSLPFCQMVRASGLAEPWTHSHEETKFDQFGWRCTNKESGYGVQTLVGNYNEEKFDIRERQKAQPLPSQYNHYFTSTYSTDFDKSRPQLTDDVKNLRRRFPNSFPGHQPEFDTAQAKEVYNDFQTTSMKAYQPFGTQSRTKLQPITTEKLPTIFPEQTMTTTPIIHLGARTGPPMTGGHVIAAPHSGPGAGLGQRQRSFRTYCGE